MPKAKRDLPVQQQENALPDRDKDAYSRAIEWMRQHSPVRCAQIEDKLKCEGFEAAGEFAAYFCQCETLRLKPWQAPPVHVRATDPDPNVYGCRPGEIALRDRLLKANLSVFEPDPIAALARAARKPAA
jgi:hypothetical protein